jgi:hypothetical protein
VRAPPLEREEAMAKARAGEENVFRRLRASRSGGGINLSCA